MKEPLSEVIIQSAINDFFWLAILVTIVVVFRTEIKNLLSSLGSAKVAGASFEFKDSRSTIESYIVLTNMMIDLLCNRDAANKLGELLSDIHLRQLEAFALKFAKEVPDDPKQLALVTNIAFVVGRRGNLDAAVKFYDSILKEKPNDIDILNLKGNALSDSGSHALLLEAEIIQDRLVETRPLDGKFWFNRAFTKSRLNKPDQAISDLDRAIDLEYYKKRKDMLAPSPFNPLRGKEAFRQLEARLKEQIARAE